MKVLLPIKPQYVSRIFDGTKRFEFRKRAFGRKVDRVVIYSSSPIMKVVGEFELLGTIVDTKDCVWELCKDFAGIDKNAYEAYYSRQEVAFALRIGNVVQYDRPLGIKDALGIKPPQSFCYLKD